MSSLFRGVPRLSWCKRLLLLPRRHSSYPQESLKQPLSGLTLQTDSPGIFHHHDTSQTRITRLDNGLRVASQEAFGQYSTIGVLVDAGSRYEVNYTSGLSHFLQKMAFQSSSIFPDRESLLNDLDRYGGVFDCQKFRDVMMYSLSVFSFSLPRAMEVLADCVLRPGLTEDEFEMTRQAIAFELEDIHNGPNSEPLLVELVHQAAYRNNTLGLPGICSEANLHKVTTKEMKQFLSSYYSPSRMVVAAVNVDHDQLVDLTQEHFVGTETSWDGVENRGVDQSLSQYTPGEVKLERHGPPVVGPNPLPELTYVALALESCSYLEDDFFAYAVLNSYMGGGGSFSAGGPGKGMYTHLYQDVLTQHHWVYWAMAQNHAYSDSGIFCLFGSAHPKKARELTEVLCQQYHHMTQLPNEVSLFRAKQQLKSAMMMNLESRLIVFEDIARQVLGQDKKLSPAELSERIDAVTGEDIVRVGKRMLESNHSMAVLGDLTHVPSKDEVQEALFKNGGSFKGRRNRLFFR